MSFTNEIGDLSGLTVVVTGANSGIGLEAARVIAGHGAEVILAVRDPARGERAAATITGPTQVRELDLARLDSVRAFAAGLGDRPVDVLINNAGVMAPPLTRTADGFELQMGTNHLGHFALTNLLLGQIRNRVVTVASNAHRNGRIALEDINWKRRPYRAWAAYEQSKLANLLFSAELARRLTAAGSSVITTAAHPGYAATNLTQSTGSIFQGLAMAIGDRVLAQDAGAGAMATVHAATQPLETDAYVGPSGPGEWRGVPKLVTRSKSAADPALAAALWSLSEELTGTSFPL